MVENESSIQGTAEYKRQSAQGQPDQDDIESAVNKIRESHEADAADDHQNLMALFPV